MKKYDLKLAGSIALVALVLIVAVCVASAQSTDPKITNTYGAGIDTAPERTSFKAALALENVDNTSDANKPVSTATQTALDLKAAIDSVQLSSFTADNDRTYTTVATLTVTDPAPVEGKGFIVAVRNGTATVGGTAYTTAGTVIRRSLHSGAWANYAYQGGAAYAAAVHTHVSADVTDVPLSEVTLAVNETASPITVAPFGSAGTITNVRTVTVPAGGTAGYTIIQPTISLDPPYANPSEIVGPYWVHNRDIGNTVTAFGKVIPDNCSLMARLSNDGSTFLTAITPATNGTVALTSDIPPAQDAVLYTAQTLTAPQKSQACKNIVARRHMAGRLPNISAFKLFNFSATAAAKAGNVRVISIGNSYETYPDTQLAQHFGRRDQSGNFGVNAIPYTSVSGGFENVTGGASFSAPTNAWVPQEAGHLTMPNGATITFTGAGSSLIVGWVGASGGGTIQCAEKPTGSGSYVNVGAAIDTNSDTNGGLAGPQKTVITLSGDRSWTVRYTVTVGTAVIPFSAITGRLCALQCGTGGGTNFSEFSTVAGKLQAGGIEKWWGAFDPQFVFVRYGTDLAGISTHWTEFLTRIRAACPNAQIIIQGKHALGASYPESEDRWAATGEAAAVDAFLQELDEPDVSYVDISQWLPSGEDAKALGLLYTDDVHLTNGVGWGSNPDYNGKLVVKSATWNALMPWLFPYGDKRIALPTKREVFDSSGWTRIIRLTTNQAATGIAVNSVSAPTAFTVDNLDPGEYVFKMVLFVSSTAAARWSQCLSITNGINLISTGSIWNSESTPVNMFYATTDSNAGYDVPIGGFKATGTSTSRIVIEGSFEINDVANASLSPTGYSFRLRHGQRVAYGGADVSSLLLGSWCELRKSYTAAHRAYLPDL